MRALGVDILVYTMFEYRLESYRYEDLSNPPPATFRIVELLPEEGGDIVSCLLHVADWSNEYEALMLEVTRTLEL